jgi:hypothetical protein
VSERSILCMFQPATFTFIPVQCSNVFQLYSAYLAEKRGNLQHMLDGFSAQRQYAEAYIRAIEPFSADDNFECFHWMVQAPWAGEEMAHFFPFREKLMYALKLAGLGCTQVPYPASMGLYIIAAYISCGIGLAGWTREMAAAAGNANWRSCYFERRSHPAVTGQQLCDAPGRSPGIGIRR